MGVLGLSACCCQSITIHCLYFRPSLERRTTPHRSIACFIASIFMPRPSAARPREKTPRSYSLQAIASRRSGLAAKKVRTAPAIECS
ncbi:MAG: hypothetical protein GDA56_02795 [Hormoscilla sp. GM7CHS1pb]|nr:hypothetical protein [Hormoscilla sp. GM7CHS1pb]